MQMFSVLFALVVPVVTGVTSTVQPGVDTLKNAINAATDGDILELEDGTYTGTDAPACGVICLFSVSELTIRAKNLHKAVIDGEAYRRGMYFSSSPTDAPPSTVEGLHFTNGEYQALGEGGAGVHWAFGRLRLRSCKFSQHSASFGACYLDVRTDALGDGGSELYNNTFLGGSDTRCGSGVMLSILTPVPTRCDQLGQWMSPNPFSSPLATFTGCRYMCEAGTYGSTYELNTSTCTGSCTIGHYCPQGSGAPTPCPVNTYMPDTGASVCLNCPTFATTASTSATSIAMCTCVQGFYESADGNGATICSACPEGATTSGAGATSVSECTCQQGRYFTVALDGTATCPICPEGATTSGAGATSVSECTCQPTLFLDEAGSCSQCAALEQPGMGGTNCAQPGSTLDDLEVQPGFWRQNISSRLVRKCTLNPDACIGGNITSQCAPGHRGPLCDLCEDNYHGGNGKACTLCEGSVGVSIAMPILGVLIAVGVVIALLSRLRKKKGGFRDAVGKLRDVVDNADGSGGDVAGALQDAVKAETGLDALDDRYAMAEAVQGKAETLAEGGGEKARLAKVVGKLAGFGVKLRILISFEQVLTQLGVSFSITYPPFYTQMLAAIDSINLSVGVLPFACLFPWASSYYFDLLTKTLLPLGLVACFVLTSRVLKKKYANAEPEGPDGEKPLGLFMADICSDLWFFTLFLMYPSVCAAIFNYFVPMAFNGEGEDGARLLRVDLSIDTTSATYGAFLVYALVMLIVFPFGVPLLYALMLFRSREELRELRRIEVTQEAKYKVAMLEADAVRETSEEDKAAMIATADAAKEATTAKLDQIRSKLPTTLRKLTAGYEMRTYWFEIFECARKIALIGLPILFEPESPGQLILGLVVCFITYGLYMMFAPYIEDVSTSGPNP